MKFIVEHPTIVMMALIVLTAATTGLLYVLDRVRASMSNQRFYLAAHIAKATALRRHKVSIEAGRLAEIFKISERTLGDPKHWNSKPGPHPATMTPARRRKLGVNK